MGAGARFCACSAMTPQSNEVVRGLVLLIGVSGSMSGGRIEAAKRAAIETVGRCSQHPPNLGISEFCYLFAFTGDCRKPGYSLHRLQPPDARRRPRTLHRQSCRGWWQPASRPRRRTGQPLHFPEPRSPQSDEQMVILLADRDDGCNNVNSGNLGIEQRRNLVPARDNRSRGI